MVSGGGWRRSSSFVGYFLGCNSLGLGVNRSGVFLDM